MTKINIDIDAVDLGMHVTDRKLIWGHLFIETENEVFVAIQRYGLSARLFGKFKVKHVLTKEKQL